MLRNGGAIMKKRNVSRALFTALFVFIIGILEVFFFPSMNDYVSILIVALAALIGYLIGDKIFNKENGNQRKN